jgi:hypothetical protein
VEPPPVVALAAGAVLSRALLAFTYDPPIGDVSAPRKYAHNAGILAGAIIVSRLQLGPTPLR